jgi:hypothetical protein
VASIEFQSVKKGTLRILSPTFCNVYRSARSTPVVIGASSSSVIFLKRTFSLGTVMQLLMRANIKSSTLCFGVRS